MRGWTRSKLASAALALALPGAVSGQRDGMAYRWTNVTVGAGGYAPDIVFSPVERGLAYLRTDMGDGYRWDAAAARWVPLQDGNAVSSYMGIESIAPDPVDADVVYMAAGMNAGAPAAILRSGDRGRTWRVVPVPFAMGGNEPGRGLGERLAVDPNDHRRLFFGSRHDGLWQSRDAGQSWTPVAGFPHKGLGRPERRTSHGGVSFVAIDPTSGKAGASQRIWAGIADPGGPALYRSDDGGVHWTAVAGPALFAAKGVVDARGVLWVGFASGIGPSDVKTGAVWRYDAQGHGRDVTPPAWRAAGARRGLGCEDAVSGAGIAHARGWAGALLVACGQGARQTLVWRGAAAGMPCRVAHGVCLASTEQGRRERECRERRREENQSYLTRIFLQNFF